jgi:hypothetical protein
MNVKAEVEVVPQENGLYLVRVFINGKLFDTKVFSERELKEFGLEEVNVLEEAKS